MRSSAPASCSSEAPPRRETPPLAGGQDPPAALRDLARTFEQPCRHLLDGHGLMTAPAAMAARGMASYFAVSGSWARVSPPLLLDGLHAEGAVRARAREEESDRPLALVLGEGAQERIDQPTPLTVHGTTRKEPPEMPSVVPGAMT